MAVQRLANVQIYFRFYGESFDPDEITQRLGIEPTLKFRPGDPITSDGRGRRRRYGWAVKVGGYDTIEIDGMLQELREQVSVSSFLVRKVCKDLDIEPVIVCGVGAERADIMPALYFPTDFLRWAAEMGASLDVDVLR